MIKVWGNLHKLAILLVVWVTPVFSAQLAQIDVNEAEVYANPDAKSSVVGTVKKSQYVAASNIPTRGFYKIRMPSGEIGWISAEVLILNPEVDGEKPETNEASKLTEKPKLDSEPKEKIGKERDRSKADEKFRLRTHFLLGFLSWSDFTSSTGFDAPSSIKAATLDIEYFVAKSFSLILRGEFMFGGVDAIDDSNKTYTFSLSSIPIYAGAGFTIGKERKFNIGFAALVGMAFSTSFSSTSTTDAAPNETIFEGSPISFLLKAQTTYFFSGAFGLSLEAGYRLLSTDALTASTVGNGAITSSLPLNYGGLYVSGGVGVKF